MTPLFSRFSPLFSPLQAEARHILDNYGALLKQTMPLKRAHLRDLPYAVADLSRLLTTERAELVRPYWAQPRLASAYAWYFLPWNLFRLCHLLPGLDLRLRARDLILDVGSGPLTLPQALWISRPDLRELELTFVCSDPAVQSLELGRALFAALTRATPGWDNRKAPWSIRLARAGFDQALHRAAQAGAARTAAGTGQERTFLSGLGAEAKPEPREAGARPALILAGNILNELKPSRNQPLSAHLGALICRIANALRPGGRVLLVEPGNRLGGKTVSLARARALDLGLRACGPCTHQRACPLLGPRGASWCHFSLPAAQAPAWLQELSDLAGLEKKHASLSFALLERPASLTGRIPCPDWAEEDEEEMDFMQPEERPFERPKSGDKARARVLSAPFSVPGAPGKARYACAAWGLLMLCGAEGLDEGCVTEVSWPGTSRRDAKTGAWTLGGADAPPDEAQPQGLEKTRKKSGGTDSRATSTSSGSKSSRDSRAVSASREARPGGRTTGAAGAQPRSKKSQGRAGKRTRAQSARGKNRGAAGV